MRILFVSSPGLGHVNPLLPLATALRERGNEVRWAVAGEFIPHLERHGFAAFSAGYEERERWQVVREQVGAPPGDGPPPGFGGPQGFATLFGKVSARRMAESLDPIVARWTPELFVHDMSELATAPTATALGIPHVTHSWAWALPPETFLGAGEATAPLWRERGLEPRPDGGVFQHLFLHPFPPGLVRGPRPSGPLQPIRPARVEPLSAEEVPGWVGALGEGAIYLTLGTIFNQVEPMRALVAALSSLGREVVVTTGPRIPVEALGPLPGNCHAAQYVAQDAVLPHCALVVSHGGAGTFLGSAMAGVPQLCLPLGADQFLNAETAAAAGLGEWLAPDNRTPGAVLEAAGRLLEHGSYRARAKAVSQEIAAMPSAEEVAVVVEALVGVRAQ